MQRQQSYDNHVRFHRPFHFFLMPLTLIVLIGSVVNLFPRFRGGIEFWFSIVILLWTVAFVVTVAIERMYANKVQDRIIRMEENFRHYVLTGKILDSRLTLLQIIALRFASDAEFVDLAERAVNENLSGDTIKKSIREWKPDFLRV